MGQIGFRQRVNEKYFNKTDCCIVVYDITDRRAFKEVVENYYIEKIKELCKKNIKVILVGNKTDLEHYRQIPYNEAANLAFLNNYLFIETSCVKNENVFDTFEKIIGIYLLERKKEEENRKEKILIKKSNRKFSKKLDDYINK